MWPRVVEFMLGCWLAIGPILFTHAVPANDFTCGILVAAFSLLSFRDPYRLAHFGTVVVGLWLIGFAFLYFPEAYTGAQHNMAITGVLLVMFGIIPNNANQPPRSWREYREARNRGR